MRENKRPKAAKPVRFRDSPQTNSNSKSKQTVDKPVKSTDLRLKLNKNKKKSDSNRVSNSSNDSNEDESNFSPDYEMVQTSDDGQIMEVSDNLNEGFESESDKDRNNNAQRVKSVVLATSHQDNPNKIQEVRQRITFSGTRSETEEGELTSGEPNDNIDSFMENADDEQLAEFFKRHQNRIQKVTDKQKKDKDESGEDDFLTRNITRMSLLDKEGISIPHNSQSEDTVYTRLVKEHRAFEQRERNDPKQDLNQDDSLTDSNSRQINTSNDSSLNTSSTNEQLGRAANSNNSTDETDKNLVMSRFINSPVIRESNNDQISEHSLSD